MISFDDGGGSYGGGSAADLSPIYRTLQILNTNTESLDLELNNIWNFVSTLSFTTISYSTPYIESYRTANENYMYNITGTIPTFNNTLQFLRGNFDILSKAYTSRTFNIDYISNLESVNFSGCDVSMTGKNFTSLTFQKCGIVDVRCRELKHMYVSLCPEVMISANYLQGLSDSLNSFSWITNLHLSGISEFKYNWFSSNSICCINNFRNVDNNSFYRMFRLNISNAAGLENNTFSSLTDVQINDDCQFGNNYLTSILYFSLTGDFISNTIYTLENLYISGGCNLNTFNTLWNLKLCNGGFASNSFNSVSHMDLYDVWMVSNTIYGSTHTNTEFFENVYMNATAQYVNRNNIQDIKTINLNCGYSYGDLTIKNCNLLNLTGNGGYIYLPAGNNLGIYNIVGNLSIGLFEKCNLKHYGQYLDKATFKSLYNGFFSDYNFRSNNISTCEHLDLTGYQINSCTFDVITEAKMDVSIASNVNYNIISSLSASIYSAKTATFSWIQSAVLSGAIFSSIIFSDISTLDVRNVKYFIYAGFENITCLRLSELSSDNIIYQTDGVLGVDIMKVENSWWNGTMLNIPSSAGLALHSSYVSIGGVAAMNYTH